LKLLSGDGIVAAARGVVTELLACFWDPKSGVLSCVGRGAAAATSVSGRFFRSP
jgi:hypothetical protein